MEKCKETLRFPDFQSDLLPELQMSLEIIRLSDANKSRQSGVLIYRHVLSGIRA
jgi:hypothetical protein